MHKPSRIDNYIITGDGSETPSDRSDETGQIINIVIGRSVGRHGLTTATNTYDTCAENGSKNGYQRH